MKEGGRGLLHKNSFVNQKNYYKGGFETMKNLKKVLALVLACAMVFSIGVTATAATAFPDVAEDASYAEAVNILSALGIIQGDENGNFNPDSEITRAEMATILCTMDGAGELSPTATKFTDVAADHWASGYINYAQQRGYIDGYDDTTFGPEDSVTYEQTIKLIMAALGYTYSAQENGGYPVGYLFVAANAGVTKGATGTGPEAAPRSTVAMLVYNAMNTPMMERVSYVTESIWQVMDGTGTRQFHTLLTERHDTFKVEGKVTSSYKQNTNMRDGYVNTEITKTLKVDVEGELGATPVVNATNSAVIDYYTLNNIDATGTDAADLIGYECVMYFSNADMDVKLVAIARKSVKNVEVTISDVSQAYDPEKDGSVRDGDKPTFTENTKQFSFWNDRDSDARITTVDLDAAADIIWNNGKTEKLAAKYAALVEDGLDDTSAILAAIVPERGSITLVDTGNDGYYDLIRVTSYDVAIVSAVDVESKTINFRSNRSTSLIDYPYVTLTDEENPNLREYTITLNGEASDVDQLEPNDVLSIATNDWDNPTYFTIIATRNPVEGYVSAVNTADGYVQLNGDSTRYEITEGMTSLTLPALEDEGTFYLDADGNIAYVDTSSVLTGDFAYMYRTGAGTFDEKYLRLYTMDGEDVNYALADRLKVNDVRKNTLDTAYTLADIAAMYGMSDTAAAEAFGVDATALASTNATLSSIFEGIDGGADPALTPWTLVDAITNERYALKADFALTGNKSADRFITYTAGSDQITEITLAVPSTSTNTFGYYGKANEVEWQASLNKFKNNADLATNAVVFFVGDANTSIDDYQVRTVDQLRDGNEYSPYFFAFTDDGVSAVLILDATTALGTDLAVFESYTMAKDDIDDVYNVTYWINGQKAETPLVVEASSPAGDEVLSMQRGDTFVFGENDKGRVDDISVIFTPGTVQPTFEGANFDSFINLSDPDVAKEYEIMGQGTGDADNQVYFGYVGKISETTNGLRMTLVDETGHFGSTNQQSVIVSDQANILYYNPTMAEARRIQAGTVGTLQPSFFQPDDAGDMDFTTSQLQHMRYAFVRVSDDVVTDVIYVRYSR